MGLLELPRFFICPFPTQSVTATKRSQTNSYREKRNYRFRGKNSRENVAISTVFGYHGKNNREIQKVPGTAQEHIFL